MLNVLSCFEKLRGLRCVLFWIAFDDGFQAWIHFGVCILDVKKMGLGVVKLWWMVISFMGWLVLGIYRAFGKSW